MATTTPNFGWPVPTSTDLVKDGATAIETLGDSVDASMGDLLGGTSGQMLVKNSNTNMDFIWQTPNVGDITEVQAGTGISVASGTGPIPVITNTATTTIDAEGDLLVGDAADALQRLAIGSNTHVLTVDTSVDGKIKWAAPAAAGFVGCKLTKSADQTIVNVTTTLISFDGEDFDTDAFHNNSTNNSRITIPSGKGGKYLFVISGNFVNAGTTGHLQTNMQKNGSAVAAGAANIYWKNVTDVVGFAVSHILEAVATDYFEFSVYSNPGNNNGYIADTTRFSCQYLGA